MEYYALVEEWPNESLVNFRELPGCLATGQTVDEALQRAPEAIAEYLRWLKQHNIAFLKEAGDSIAVVVKEHLRADRVGALFTSELVAPMDQEMENALTVAATARTLLAALYESVPPAQRSLSVKPGEWSLAEHLRHIIKAEVHYVGCLSDEPMPEDLPPIAEAELSRTLVENGLRHDTFLRGLTPEQRAHVYTHGEAQWTAAKTLRRMTEHLRDHYPVMQTIARQLDTSA